MPGTIASATDMSSGENSLEKAHQLIEAEKPRIESMSATNSGSGSQCNIGRGVQNIATAGSTQYVGHTLNIGTNNEDSGAEIPQKLRAWLLANHIVNERYDTSIHRRYENTCEWILTHKEFESWRKESSSSPKIFWLHGPAGFGKTVLCTRIIQEVKAQKGMDVAYYFFSSDLESPKDPIVAMRSWIYHMFLINQSVFDIVKNLWARGTEASQDVIIKLFQEAIKLVSNCTLVVDGLNECIPGVPGSSCLSLSEFIGVVYKAVLGTNTKILVMSRTEPSIRKALAAIKDKGDLFEHKISEQDVNPDIHTLSKHIVADKLSDPKTEKEDDLVKKLVDRSKGRFLWLKLQQDSLREGLTVEQFKQAVDTAPADLTHIYHQNWAKIRELPANDQTRAISLLRLAAFSLRSLTVREISEAVLASDDYSDFPVYELPRQWDDKIVKEKILDPCYSLLEIRKQNAESPIEEQTVHLVHSSVKEFLFSHMPESDKQSIGSRIAAQHAILAKLCIAYMNHSHTWQASAGDAAPRLGSFTNYAAKFWNKHAEAGMSQKARLTEVAEFFDESSPSWSLWRNWFDSANKGWANTKGKPTIPLCYAIELGFVGLASAMIKKGKASLNHKSSNRTALGVACSKGYVSLARELLTYGAEIGMRDAWGRTAVYYAALNGHLALVTLLNGQGADIRIQDYDGVTPFLAASANGHLKIMRQLIQKGANIHQLDVNGEGALFKASSNNHIKAARLLIGKGVHYRLKGTPATPLVIKTLKNGFFDLARLLIENEANINARTEVEKQTILHVAISIRKSDIVKLLVDRGAELALQDAEGRTPLFLACFHGQSDVVKLLLERHADHTVATHDNQTPLYAACCNGHFEIVKLLLDKHADHAIATAETGQTPFIAACGNGHAKIVELLIKEGVAITTPDKQGRTPLHVACANCHLKVVELLMDQKVGTKTFDTMGFTPHSAAALGGSLDILKQLFKNYTDSMKYDLCGAILAASEGGHHETVEWLIDAAKSSELENIKDIKMTWVVDDITNAETNVMDMSLIRASYNGHQKVVKLLLDNGASWRKGNDDPRFQTPLYGACRNGHTEVAKLLIEKKADVNAAADEYRYTPLAAACANGCLDLVNLLVQEHADLHAVDIDGMNVAHVAAQHGQLKVLQHLLSLGANISFKSFKGWLPIHLASQNGHSKIVDLLAEHGSDVTVAVGNEDGNTPMVIASYNGHADVVNVLLKHGVDVDTKDSFGQTSLVIASSVGKLELAKLLIDHCADVSTPDKKGRTPLFFASGNGHFEVVELLLENGAAMTPNNEGQTPAYIASANGHIDILRLLTESGANVTTKDNQGYTPLHASCFSDHITTTRLLLKMGADINSCNNEGFTPLYLASEEGHQAIVECLIMNGANSFGQSNGRYSPITAASSKGHTETVSFLIEKREIPVEQPDGYGRTPLFAACEAGRINIVRYLIEKGAVVNNAVNGITPLFAACEAGHVRTARYLIEKDANVDRAVNNTTPLLAACIHGHLEVVKLLLEHGADRSVTSKDGKTPAEAAAAYGHTEICELLNVSNKDINITAWSLMVLKRLIL